MVTGQEVPKGKLQGPDISPGPTSALAVSARGKWLSTPAKQGSALLSGSGAEGVAPAAR